MLFHTWPFFLFLLVVLPVYLVLRPTRLAVWWLFVASYFFYGWWNPLYLLLIFYSTVLDYVVVILMDRSDRKPARHGARDRVMLTSTNTVIRRALHNLTMFSHAMSQRNESAKIAPP